jgi:WD40 repeat protein
MRWIWSFFPQDYVLSVAVSPDGAWVVSGSKDRGVQFWNPKDAQTQLMLQGHKNSGKFHHRYHRSFFYVLKGPPDTFFIVLE